MRIKKIAAFMVFLVALSGCATRPATPEEHAQTMLEHAERSTKAGDLKSSYAYLTAAFDAPGQEGQILKFFNENPQRKESFIKALNLQIETGLVRPSDAAVIRRNLEQSTKNGYIDENSVDNLSANLIAKAKRSNESGAVPFTLSDHLKGLGILEDPAQMQVVLNRTLEKAKTSNNPLARQTSTLMAYAVDPSTPKSHKDQIEKTLDQIPLTKSEMESLVRPVFPKYAATRLSEMTIKAALSYIGADRLAQDDLLKEMKSSIKGIDWQQDAAKDGISIKVDRIRYAEVIDPPQTQTIRYPQSQVYVMAAALFMPQNSTYAYNYTTSGISIEYGYEVSVIEKNKVIHTEIIRGNETVRNSSCSDAIIQNVLGGIQPASFVANDDMAARCNAAAITVDTLRKRIDSKIIESILKAPSINRVHLMNS